MKIIINFVTEISPGPLPASRMSESLVMGEPGCPGPCAGVHLSCLRDCWRSPSPPHPARNFLPARSFLRQVIAHHLSVGRHECLPQARISVSPVIFNPWHL